MLLDGETKELPGLEMTPGICAQRMTHTRDIKMKKTHWRICFRVVIFALFFMTNPVQAGREIELLQQAELHWSQKEDIKQSKRAAEIYEEILQADPGNYEAAWKLSRAYLWIGRHESSSGVKKDHFRKGIELARHAVSIKPKEAAGHYWLAANSGSLAEALGYWPWLLLRKASLASEFKREMETVLRLNPAFSSGGAYRALGRYYLEKPFPSRQKAEKYLEEAVRIAPMLLCNHLDLAKAYVKEGKVDLARERRLHILHAPQASEFAVENKRCRKKARLLQIE